MLFVRSACLTVAALFVGKAVARPLCMSLPGVVEQQRTSESLMHTAADHHAYAHAAAIDPDQVIAPVADIMHTNHMLYRRLRHDYTATEVSNKHTEAADAHIDARKTWDEKVPGSTAKQDHHNALVEHHDNIAGQVENGEHADNLNFLHQQAVDSIKEAHDSKKEAEGLARAAQEAEAARQAARQAARARHANAGTRRHR